MMEEIRNQLRKLQFSLLTQKKYFYYYISKHIPIYYSANENGKITVTSKGIIFHRPNVELNDFIVAMHGFVSKWPQRRKEFIEKHGFLADIAFDLAASLKAAIEADTEVKIDLARLGLEKDKLRKNSVETLAKELLPNIEGIPISLGISFGKEKTKKPQENNQNAGGNGNAESNRENQPSEGEGNGENENEGNTCNGIPISIGGGVCDEGNDDGGQQGEPNDGEGNAEVEDNGEDENEGEDGDTPVEIQKGNTDENGNANLPQIVADAINYENMISAGRGLGADRILDELTRPKINIWRLINSTIAQGIRKSRRTWRRLNRKLPMIRPGREYYGCDAMVLLDSSGSISERTYKKFAGIIEQLMRRGGRFHVISFSDGYIDHGINPNLFKIKTKSGGTYPQCLIPVITKEKPQMLIMLTDGEFFGDYSDFLKTIQKVPNSILITTHEKYRQFKKVFKIEGE
jgi:hypothetical protein